MTLTAVGVIYMFALALGADEEQVDEIHEACMPLIDALHGRKTAVEWLLRQSKDALMFKAGSGDPENIVTTYLLRGIYAKAHILLALIHGLTIVHASWPEQVPGVSATEKRKFCGAMGV